MNAQLRKKLITINAVLINIIAWYLLLRFINDSYLNAILDTSAQFVQDNIDVAAALLIGVLTPQEKAKEFISFFKANRK